MVMVMAMLMFMVLRKNRGDGYDAGCDSGCHVYGDDGHGYDQR